MQESKLSIDTYTKQYEVLSKTSDVSCVAMCVCSYICIDLVTVNSMYVLL